MKIIKYNYHHSSKFFYNYELTKGTKHSAGIDLPLIDDIIISSGETKKVNLGLSLEIPEQYYGLLVPRSSFGLTGLYMHIGIIDSDYRGSISAVISNYNKKSLFQKNSIKLNKFDKIAQIIIQPYNHNCKFKYSTELSKTTRNTSGFGSTGK